MNFILFESDSLILAFSKNAAPSILRGFFMAITNTLNEAIIALGFLVSDFDIKLLGVQLYGFLLVWVAVFSYALTLLCNIYSELIWDSLFHYVSFFILKICLSA